MRAAPRCAETTGSHTHHNCTFIECRSSAFTGRKDVQRPEFVNSHRRGKADRETATALCYPVPGPQAPRVSDTGTSWGDGACCPPCAQVGSRDTGHLWPSAAAATSTRPGSGRGNRAASLVTCTPTETQHTRPVAQLQPKAMLSLVFETEVPSEHPSPTPGLSFLLRALLLLMQTQQSHQGCSSTFFF